MEEEKVKCIEIETPKHNFKYEMIIGNIRIFSEKHYNLFQKFMYKICFNIEIKEVKE